MQEYKGEGVQERRSAKVQERRGERSEQINE